MVRSKERAFTSTHN